MLVKPDGLFDRQQEWDLLAGLAEDERPGPRLAVVRGRRRHGKSVLLRALCAAAGGLYHQAVEGTAVDQLGRLAATLESHLGVRPSLPDWDAAVRLLLDTDALPRVIVLDELSYLIDADPALPSILQLALDDRVRRGRAVRLVLCGSALSVMSRLLVGSAPLRGRAAVELPLRPFDHRSAAAFRRHDDPLVALQVHAVLGGVPGYSVDLLDGDVPSGSDDIDAWMARGPLAVGRPLLHEARHLLDEPGLRDRGWYLSVLAAVASGDGTNSAVSSRLARPSAAVAQALAVLADLGLVRRMDDPLRARRPVWQVADPLLRFWAGVLRPEWARLEEGRAEEVWAASQSRWRTQVLGPCVEDLARAWTAEGGAGEVRTVARAVVSDPAGRTQHEIDVVGLDATRDGVRVAVLGEAKAGLAGAAELARLRRLRELLTARGVADPSTRLLLVGAAGVDPSLAGPDVELVDAERLYAP